MKNILYIILTLPLASFAQGFNIQYDFMGNEQGESTWDIELQDDGYLLFQTVDQPSGIGVTIATKKISFDGEVMDENIFIPNNTYLYNGWANSASQTNEGNYVLGGGWLSGFAQSNLVLYNPIGDTVWMKTFGDPIDSTFHAGYSAIQTNDGGYLLVGGAEVLDTLRGFAVKTDSEGNEMWRKYYGDNPLNVFSSVTPTSNGEFIVGGIRRIANTNENTWVVRLDSMGNVIWEYDYGDIGHWDMNASLCVGSSDNEYIIASGIATLTNNGLSDLYPYVAKIDGDGVVIWEYTYGEDYLETGFTSVKRTSTSGYICAGVSTASNFNYEGLLLRLNESGDSLWMRRYHWLTDEVCFFRDVIASENGGFVASGLTHTHIDSQVNINCWVVKTDEFGCVVPGCQVNIIDQSEIADFLLYPNPTSDFLNIYLQALQMDLKGQIVILDISGKEILNYPTIGGNINLGLDVSEYAQGMYIVQFRSDSVILKSEKLVVE